VRPTQEIVPSTSHEAFVQGFDLRDIDNPDRRSFWRLKYLARIGSVVTEVRRHLPPGSRIIEIGCAQANMSLLLAESGYDCTACDMQADSIAYSQKKFSHGSMNWVVGDAFDQPAVGTFDGVILSELLEHVAHPDRLLERAVSMVRVGGFVVVTTPNGDRLGCREPTLTEARRDLAGLEARQFGPAGEDHLFEMIRSELRSLIPASTSVATFAGVGSVLYCNAAQPVLRLPGIGSLAHMSIDGLDRVPALRWLFSDTLLCTLRREA
jgi:SAM-dependent methyltransferase